MTTTAAVLGRLEVAGLIRLARAQPQVEYLFRHALVHDAAYESISRKDRRRLHRAAGEILAELSVGRLDEVAGTLAFHFERAGMPERAVVFQLRAAERAARAYANAEAIGLYRAALEGPAADTIERGERAAAFQGFGGVLELVGHVDEAIGAYRRALEHTDGEELLTRARLHRRIGNAHRIARRVPQARESFENATARLDEVVPGQRAQPWWSERIDLLLDRALLHYFWGTYDELRDVLDACAPALDRYATDAQRTRYHARRALHMVRSNHMVMTDEALAVGKVAYDLWRSVGDPTDAELAVFQLGLFHVMRGELSEARQHLHDSLAAAELTGDVVLQSRCLIYLALAARFEGDIAEMERTHERAERAVSAGGLMEYEAMIEADRCWAAWRRGDLAEAHARGGAALELSGRLPGTHVVEASVRLPLLAMALEKNDLDGAIEYARALVDGIWVDDTFGTALQAAVEAHSIGEAHRAREELEHALEGARRIGWI